MDDLNRDLAGMARTLHHFYVEYSVCKPSERVRKSALGIYSSFVYLVAGDVNGFN